jgi:K+-transporting ATPase KdpF subunit
MSSDDIVGLILALLATVYLIVVLLIPEKF